MSVPRKPRKSKHRMPILFLGGFRKFPALVLLMFLLILATSVISADEEDPSKHYFLSSNDNGEDVNKVKSSGKEKKKMISLAESIEIYRKRFQDPDLEKLRKQYWKDTFADIQNLTGGFNKMQDEAGANFLNQWKLATKSMSSSTAAAAATSGSSSSNNNATTAFKTTTTIKRPRFEGFPSWERMIQDWRDEIDVYLQQHQEEKSKYYAEQASEAFNTTDAAIPQYLPYSLREPANSTTTTTASGTSTAAAAAAAVTTVAVPKTAATKKPQLPVPAPAKPGQAVLPHTDVSDPTKRILIVTTASLPWRTGTAVNPLLRAAYLVPTRSGNGTVTLMLPWLERMEDQKTVYGVNNTFATPQEQELYLRDWLEHSANFPQAAKELKIQWYTGWQNKVENSIYSMGDITALVSADDVDICILEEPEHLNWYRAPGESWTKKFKHVVGILHTNYFSYALDQPAALIRAPAMRLLCSWMCRAHCHRIIKLSGTLDKMAPEKELVENVHGVRGTFLDVGEEVRRRIEKDNIHDPVFGAQAKPKLYFIGKMLWSKGLGSLMELLKYAEESADLRVSVDMYGSGPDMEAADAKAKKLGLDLPFHGPLDHAELDYTHKIFVNPSTSEVLCTTSAEALAMGKFVILPSHPSNDFFAQFPNCLTYATKEEFVGNLYYAMTHAPEPLSEQYAHALSWEAATERLAAASSIPQEEADLMKEFMASEEAAIEVPLPVSIVDDEESRKDLTTVLQYTRLRYRQFRNRLSSEVESTKVLPKPLREKLVADLNNRLDLDFDEILESPKLKLKLSPAELDAQLLELYENVVEGPGGDLLRLVGGGGQVGLQNLYMKWHAERERWRKLNSGGSIALFPTPTDEFRTDENNKTASQWVRWSLRKNQQKLANTLKITKEIPQNNEAKVVSSKQNQDTPSMCFGIPSQRRSTGFSSWSGLRPVQSLYPRKSSPQRTAKFSILI